MWQGQSVAQHNSFFPSMIDVVMRYTFRSGPLLSIEKPKHFWELTYQNSKRDTIHINHTESASKAIR
jgi:hypothetical protein